MTWRRRILHELTRERRLSRRGGRRTDRSSRAGVALLLVISIVALMTVLVTEVVYAASVRIQLAANQRDEAKAEALAQSGLQFYKLILVASSQLKNQADALIVQYSQFLPGGLNALELWQLIPTVSTQMLRMVLVVGDDESDLRQVQAQGGLSDKQLQESREGAKTSLKKAFLDFDGDWTASVTDEDRRIYVGGFKGETLAEVMTDPNAGLLLGMMAGQDHANWLRARDLQAQELLGDLADWTDANDNRAWDGSRESLNYERLDDPYLPKNAPFDTVEEIRLVEGWNRDAVWERFGKHLTIYGNGKINVNTAPPKVLAALLRSSYTNPPSDDAIDLLVEVIRNRLTTPIIDGGGGPFRSEKDFVSFVQANNTFGDLDPQLASRVAVRSSTFRLSSTGVVGDASVEIEAVIDFSGGKASNNPLQVANAGNALFGRTVYWRVR